MNEDELYQEISWETFHNLDNKLGYYKVMYVIYDNSIIYYLNGQAHRLNGPAWIDKPSKLSIYYQYGKRHKLDGPAYIDERNKYNIYYLNGTEYTKEEFDQHPLVIQYRIRKFQESMK